MLRDVFEKRVGNITGARNIFLASWMVSVHGRIGDGAKSIFSANQTRRGHKNRALVERTI